MNICTTSTEKHATNKPEVLLWRDPNVTTSQFPFFVFLGFSFGLFAWTSTLLVMLPAHLLDVMAPHLLEISTVMTRHRRLKSYQ